MHMKKTLYQLCLSIALIGSSLFFASCDSGSSGGSSSGGGAICPDYCIAGAPDPCTANDGMNCAAGPNLYGFVSCNDGFQFTNVLYYCSDYNPIPDPTELTVTPLSAGGGGFISPDIPQSVTEFETTSFTVNPDAGFSINSVGGGCGGNLNGNTYTTNPITTNCTVVASFVITEDPTPTP
jgi:hypothetical protein